MTYYASNNCIGQAMPKLSVATWLFAMIGMITMMPTGGQCAGASDEVKALCDFESSDWAQNFSNRAHATLDLSAEHVAKPGFAAQPVWSTFSRLRSGIIRERP